MKMLSRRLVPECHTGGRGAWCVVRCAAGVQSGVHCGSSGAFPLGPKGRAAEPRGRFPSRAPRVSQLQRCAALAAQAKKGVRKTSN